MPDRIFRQETSDKVEELLRKFAIRRPPVPVDKIAKKLNIVLAPLPATDDDISGAIVRKGKSVVIVVNPAHHINRQRFTIAHELGHFFLHEGLEQHVDQNFRVSWRNADSSKAVDWSEIQANRFAAELLMPTRFMLADLDSLDVIDRHAVAVLAAKYMVSPGAMKIRLSQFGILSPDSNW